MIDDVLQIGALVVLFRPLAEQVDHLLRLRAQTPHVLAVDNSMRADPELAATLAAHAIAYWHNGNHGGIAGAYNAGLTRLFAEGLNAVALFDQDSVVSEDYFPLMHESSGRFGVKPFVIGPQIFDANARRFMPQIVSNGFTWRRLSFEGCHGPQRCSFLLSSGSVISRGAYEKLGAFAEAFFIDHVDTDYAMRALQLGVPFYIEPRLVLTHRIGHRRVHRLGSLRVTSMNHPAERRYYMARNGMFLCRQYVLSFPVAIAPNVVTLMQIAQVLLFEGGKLAKLAAIGCGLIDGLYGRLGPIESERPGLLRWASDIA